MAAKETTSMIDKLTGLPRRSDKDIHGINAEEEYPDSNTGHIGARTVTVSTLSVALIATNLITLVACVITGLVAQKEGRHFTEKSVASMSHHMDNKVAQLETNLVRLIAKRNRREITDNLITNNNASTATVAFNVRESTDYNISVGQIVNFKYITLNEGQGYDSATGLFTAPVGGVYLLTVQLCTFGKHIYFGIVVNNELRSVGMIAKHHYNACRSTDIVVAMKPGMQAWVKTLKWKPDAPDDNRLYHNKDTAEFQPFNSFSGVLLFV